MVENLSNSIQRTVLFLLHGAQQYIPRISMLWFVLALVVLSFTGIFCWKQTQRGVMNAAEAIGKFISAGYILIVIIITFGTRLPGACSKFSVK